MAQTQEPARAATAADYARAPQRQQSLLHAQRARYRTPPRRSRAGPQRYRPRQCLAPQNTALRFLPGPSEIASQVALSSAAPRAQTRAPPVQQRGQQKQRQRGRRQFPLAATATCSAGSPHHRQLRRCSPVYHQHRRTTQPGTLQNPPHRHCHCLPTRARESRRRAAARTLERRSFGHPASTFRCWL